MNTRPLPLLLFLLLVGINTTLHAQSAKWNTEEGRTVSVVSPKSEQADATDFSFSVWVKLSGTDSRFPSIASNKTWEQSKVIDLLSSRNMGMTLEAGSKRGWTIAIQPNGAWSWNIGDGRRRLDYLPTVERQNVIDDQWHLLAFSINQSNKTARLYFDGHNVAIYSINWFGPGTFDGSCIVGGDREQDVPTCGIQGTIEDARVRRKQLSDDEVFEIYRRRFPNAQPANQKDPVKELKVLSWNIWHGARHPGNPKGINQAIDFIKFTEADIITMQETYGSGAMIADRLGYYFYLRSDNLSIMSRYPIKDTYPLYRALWFGGASIQLSEKQEANVFCVWLNHLPAWRRNSATEGATAEALVEGEWKTRATELKDILSELQPFVESADETPLIVGGDFNSPSLLDWGKDTAEWHQGLEVRWPVSEQMLELGFTDAYRAIHKNAAEHSPHDLWKTGAKQLTYRIDYLYSLGAGIQVVDAMMMNVHKGEWPSDHPAVLAIYLLNSAEEHPARKSPSKPRLEHNPPGNDYFEKGVKIRADGEAIKTGWFGHAAPALFDIDGDGDQDLLVGQYTDGDVKIFKNIGSDDQPQYTADGKMMAGGEIARVETFCCVGFTPCIVDFDGDGNPDILTGSYPGNLYLFRGNTDRTFQARQEIQDENGNVLNPGRATTAQAVDLDGDGDYDLLSSLKSGGVVACYNQGTLKAPRFGKWEKIFAGGQPIPYAHAGPVVVDFDRDGIDDLIVASEEMIEQDCWRARLYFCKNLAVAGKPLYEEPQVILDGHVGLRLKACPVDYDRDGYLDLLVGDMYADCPQEDYTGFVWFYRGKPAPQCEDLEKLELE